MAATPFAAHAAQQDDSRGRLCELIREKSLLRDGAFKLSSGEESNYFFNMKMTMLDPEGANLIADMILARPEIKGVDAIGGVAMGAVPIVSVVSARSYYTDHKIPAFFVRKEIKGHGTNKLIEGYLKPGTKAMFVEDVTTTGSSAMLAIRAARAAGCHVDHVVTVVDRLEGARENLLREGINLLALFTRVDFETR